jgi:hypothetical protein
MTFCEPLVLMVGAAFCVPLALYPGKGDDLSDILREAHYLDAWWRNYEEMDPNSPTTLLV